MATTYLSNLVDPEVLAPMIDAKLDAKLALSKFAKIDTTLEGEAGSTITIPRYGYIGAADDVAEGADITPTAMSKSTQTATIKQIGKGVEITDVAAASAYGDPVGQAGKQLSLAIADKIENDCLAAALTTSLTYDGTAAVISYNAIVSAIDKFEEEVNSDKVIFIHPTQVTTLRKDSNFISADKYNNSVIMYGEIGMICNTRVVASKRVPLVKYTVTESSTANALKVVASSPSSGEVALATVKGFTFDETNGAMADVAVNDYVLAAANPYYLNPILKLTNDSEAEDDLPPITIYLKKGVMTFTQRAYGATKTGVFATKLYVAALSNESKVVLAEIKK